MADRRAGVVRIVAWLAVPMIALQMFAAPAGAEKRVALVIGNSDYALVPPLANPANDAALMARILKDVGFEVMDVRDADRRAMARAIRDFGKRLRQAGPEATGLFYYAGHGVQSGGANYLIPLAAPIEDEADLEIEAVSASFVLGQMESAGNALNMVILDACRNNPFKGSFRSANRGLVRMNAPSGSLVAYSAAPGQVALDGTGANSPYTAALVAVMREPGLDLEDVFKRVRVRVESETGGRQTPWEESSLKGDFYFTPQQQPPAVAEATPPSDEVRRDEREFTIELTFWQSIQASQDAGDYRAYLDRFPEGNFAPLAKARLKRFGTAAEPTPEPVPQAAAGPDVVEAAFWQSAEASNEAADYEAYLGQYPDGHFTALARTRIAALQPTQAASVEAGDVAQPVPDEPASAASTEPGPAIALAMPLSELNSSGFTAQARNIVFKIVKTYFSNSRIRKRIRDGNSGHMYVPVEISDIHSVRFLRKSERGIVLELNYRWEDPETHYGRSETADVTLERDGSSYRVVDFE